MDLHEAEDLLAYRSELPVEAIEALLEYIGIGLFNMDLATGDIAINRSGCLLTGFEPGDVPEDENTRETLTYEEDRDLVRDAQVRLMSGEANRYHIEYRMRRKDGSIVAVDEAGLVIERDEEGHPARLALIGRDLTRLRWAEDKARQMETDNRRLALGLSDNDLADQNRILRALNLAARMIIGGFHQDYETTLQAALQVIGESVLANRVRIWRNIEIEGTQSYFLRTAWSQDISVGDTVDQQPIGYDAIIPDWHELMRESPNQHLAASELSSELHEVFDICDGSYFLLAPLYLNGEFWGMLGVDSTNREHDFTEDEAEILIPGVLVIASSISRNETFGKLNEARETALASTRAKAEFLSRMSHEIRTPINAIIGMTTIAKKSKDPERISYCLEKVDSSSRQLFSLINDVLDMSKIDSGKFEIVNGPFDFRHVLSNVLNIAEVKFAEKGQHLVLDNTVDFSRLIVSDELRLSQVLTNLLTNATKFTPEGGQITLMLRSQKLESASNKEGDKASDGYGEQGGYSRLHVEIRDTGIGISREKQLRLFHSFEQADNSITRIYGGTGLGLAICKRIVDLMGGNIWVESEEGVGSNFIFEVEVGWGDPIVSVAVSGKGTGATAGSGTNNAVSMTDVAGMVGAAGAGAGSAVYTVDDMTIDWTGHTLLLVEDIEVNREIVIQLLAETGVEIVSAVNGQEALDIFLKDPERFDLIMMDLQMPVMDGITATKNLRAIEDIPWARKVPIVAMTANAFKEDAQMCLAAGMDEHIAKPFDMSDLIRRLSRYLDVE
ncbi:MAG: response regulator [Coriobacteriales bacterium]|nr:response regulator [Coriobacteriales bacterium]